MVEMPANTKFVYSTDVSRIGYDDTKQELWVQFVRGSVYVYFGVDPKTAKEVMNAPSIGTALNTSIKGHYSYKRIE